MPFGLKNAPSEFQKVMNDIFNPYTTFLTVYIDDVLIFSQNIEQHFKHLKTFIHVVKKNGLVISNKKTSLFQTKIRFLVHYVHHGTIKPIARAIQFAKKFPDQVINKTQLQRFLGSLNYVVDFIPNLSVLCKPLHDRLKKNPPLGKKNTPILSDKLKNKSKNYLVYIWQTQLLSKLLKLMLLTLVMVEF